MLLTGGQVVEKMYAPLTLMSRVKPSPLQGTPLEFSQVKLAGTLTG